MQKLNHLSTKRAAESGVFVNVIDYDDMIKKIRDFGTTLGKPGSDEYNDFVGGAFEVFTEFFFRRYGTSANPHLNVRAIEDTSQNKYQAGYDFTYENFKGEICLLQVKFRSNPTDTFDQSAFGTFCFQAMSLGITGRARLVWFTNLSNAGEHGIFNRSIAKQGQEMMRVFGKDEQTSFIDRDPTFWRDLQFTVSQALIAPTDFQELQVMWDHQKRMNAACQSILDNGGNGRIICATGGGKTRVILQNVIDGFARGFETIVVVAPTIDLLRQHHEYFRRYNLFHRDGVSVIHFRTGDECRDNWADIKQTTLVDDVEAWLKPKTIIFVTYASEFKLFEGLRKREMTVDMVLWDEYHHTVRQDKEQLEHLGSLPSARNIFYSASIKRGRLISGDDPEIYGPILCEVKYAELRLLGVLVPKIIVKVIRLADGKRIRGLRDAMKRAAKAENFDLETAIMEAAGTIAAYNDKKKSGDSVTNIVTFSKAVAICKELTTNEFVRQHFNGLLETVHAGVPSRDRKKIYERIASPEQKHDSVLCQFSVVKEGIDINPFNTVVFSRSMDIIGTQQAIGRAVRANPEDTKNLHAGLIDIDKPEGWKKYSATLYVIIHEKSNVTFNDFLKDLVAKLQFAGLDTEELTFEDIEEQRHCQDNEEKWIGPLEKELNKVGDGSLKDAVANTVIELQRIQKEEEAMAEYAKARAKLADKDFKTRMNMILNGEL